VCMSRPIFHSISTRAGFRNTRACARLYWLQRSQTGAEDRATFIMKALQRIPCLSPAESPTLWPVSAARRPSVGAPSGCCFSRSQRRTNGCPGAKATETTAAAP
jgi:hypothetical protein